MIGEIQRALTIQITADDLTGGAWSGITERVEELKDDVVSLNQAWELGAKIYEAAAAALERPLEALKAGGDFAEMEAGLQSLASTYGISSKMIVDRVREITDGTIGIREATEMASGAIARGFSYQQIGTVFELAQKWADAFGGSVVQNAEALERGLMGAPGRINKEFGLAIESTDTMAQRMEKLRLKIDSLGPGVFNFNDAWTAVKNSVADVELIIGKAMNALSADIESAAKQFRAEMLSVEKLAPEIATAIYLPIKDTLKAIGLGLDSLFGWMFDSTDDLGVKVTTVVVAIGNTFYDTAKGVMGVYNIVAGVFDEFVRTGAAALEGLYSAYYRIGEATGTMSQKTLEGLYIEIETLRKIQGTGLFKYDVSNITKAQDEYNTAILKAGEAHQRLKRDPIKPFWEETEKAAGGATKATKAAGDAYKKAAEEYGLYVKAAREDYARTGNLEEYKQRIKGANDKFNADTQKKKQSDAASSKGTSSASDGKYLEIRAPDSPNVLEALIKTIIDELVKAAKLEGTKVQA
jgi:hypothetical protein